MKYILAILLTMGVLNFANNANALPFKGHNYEFIEFAGKSWSDAEEHMSKKLGSEYYLATITSQEEQYFIANDLLSGITGQYWLGGFQLSDEKDPVANWNWSSREIWSYSNWRKGEPNDYFGEASEQHLAMWKRNGWDWEWNDEGNISNISGYIAESVVPYNAISAAPYNAISATPVPEPATIVLFGAGLVVLATIGRRKKNTSIILSIFSRA